MLVFQRFPVKKSEKNRKRESVNGCSPLFREMHDVKMLRIAHKCGFADAAQSSDRSSLWARAILPGSGELLRMVRVP